MAIFVQNSIGNNIGGGIHFFNCLEHCKQAPGYFFAFFLRYLRHSERTKCSAAVQHGRYRNGDEVVKAARIERATASVVPPLVAYLLLKFS